MMDAQIKLAGEALGVIKPEDWCAIRPEQIRKIHGCGPATVDHLRLYLAARGLTLRDDATPAYWQQNLASARIGGQISVADKAVTAPFTILVDNQETYPFRFQGMTSDANTQFRPLLVPTRIVSMGPTHGDYSIEGYEGRCHVERKGMEDAHGTFLSHGDRLERWLKTLDFLAGIETAAVVIECTMGEMIKSVVSRGSRTVGVLRKTIHRQVLAWEMDYRVPFVFCDSRRLAELTTYAILNRHYRHANKQGDSQVDEELEAAIAAL